MSSSTRLRSVICWTSAAALFLGFLPTLWFYLDRAFRMVLETNNEGWVAYFADRAVHGGVLYPGADEMVMNNYPPLSFYVIGMAGLLTGDTVLAGRLISILALFAIAVTIGVLVARATSKRSAGAFTAAFFLMLFSAYPGGRIGLNDPQLLGHAVMLVGLAVIWLYPERFGAMFCAAIIMALAGLIKHNIIAVPLAVTAWAAWRGLCTLLCWLAAAGLAILLAGALLLAVWGQPALLSILSPRQLSVMKLVEDTRRMLYLADIPLAAWLVVVVCKPRDQEDLQDRETGLTTALVGAGLLELVISAGGYGVAANMAFDLVIGLSLALGLAVGRLPQTRAAIVLVAVLVFHVALVMPLEPVRILAGMLPGKAADEARIRASVAYITAQSGPVLCFDPVLCWYAGKPFLFDRYNMSQQFVFGRRSEEDLLGRVRRHEFAMIEMLQGTLAVPEVPTWGRLASVLQENYEVVRSTDGFVFLLPRPTVRGVESQ